jgi:hypothetical protein
MRYESALITGADHGSSPPRTTTASLTDALRTWSDDPWQLRLHGKVPGYMITPVPGPAHPETEIAQATATTTFALA